MEDFHQIADFHQMADIHPILAMDNFTQADVSQN